MTKPMYLERISRVSSCTGVMLVPPSTVNRWYIYGALVALCAGGKKLALTTRHSPLHQRKLQTNPVTTQYCSTQLHLSLQNR